VVLETETDSGVPYAIHNASIQLIGLEVAGVITLVVVVAITQLTGVWGVMVVSQ
jgi:hypothetical protein